MDSISSNRRGGEDGIAGISDGRRDPLLFYESFHGDDGAGIGASHQTGWTGCIAALQVLFGTLRIPLKLHEINQLRGFGGRKFARGDL